ncbi:hypothetical protein [Ralstonia solanacearum]|uniref:hypothetical protein n=1 Tax=Ralstonia solanacearum TaxID=305 RepID=UPI00078B6476|nr:hypothetical protein [Ralstonia solanacearum]AMP37653.1 hypothetical protein LBM2029_08935 [Ralstonia solanacearum]AXV86479.1 hypothetical protein CJO78_09255 [Ralstonia solanacearum]AXW05981.1 hypothetical protein CJO82_09030 [Ralstonia solanacearum]AXW23725.1 hypothetical protein CJO86_09035 [Ralstonia solanacearum]AXW80657.1 hypothetical protein CJO98_09265 [Ralstonia solanacearum]
MIGLLQRLAARAAGTATVIRSNVRLPFAGGDFSAPDGVAGWPTAEMPQHEAGPPHRAGPAPAARMHEPIAAAPRQAWPQPIRGIRPIAVAPTHPTHVSQPGPQDDARLFTSLAADAATPSDARHPQHEAPAPTEPAANPLPGTPGADPAMPGVRHRPALPASSPAPPHSHVRPLMPPASHTAVTTSALPQPQALARLPARLQPAPAADSMEAASAAREPTEVHIHIGRIEVTAVQEAAPARRGPATPASAPSLDAYLAKRSGR